MSAVRLRGGPFDGEAMTVIDLPQRLILSTPQVSDAESSRLRDHYLYRRRSHLDDMVIYEYVDYGRRIEDTEAAMIENAAESWIKVDPSLPAAAHWAQFGFDLYVLARLTCPLCGITYSSQCPVQPFPDGSLPPDYVQAVLERQRYRLNHQRYCCSSCQEHRFAHLHPEHDLTGR